MIAPSLRKDLMARLGITDRGLALPMVILMAVGILALSSTFLNQQRGRAEETGLRAQQTIARQTAEAALYRAVAALIDPGWSWTLGDELQTWVYGDMTAEISVQNERSKVSLTNSDPLTIRSAIDTLGLSEDEAAAMTDAIIDWQDQDDDPLTFGAESDDYIQQDREFYIRNRPFRSLGELKRVRGIDGKLYQRLTPLFSVRSQKEVPETILMSPELRQALSLDDTGVEAEFGAVPDLPGEIDLEEFGGRQDQETTLAPPQTLAELYQQLEQPALLNIDITVKSDRGFQQRSRFLVRLEDSDFAILEWRENLPVDTQIAPAGGLD